jgi:hypothetical protein
MGSRRARGAATAPRPTKGARRDARLAIHSRTTPDFDLAPPGLKEAWERGDHDQFLVDALEEPIRYTEGESIGIKR